MEICNGALVLLHKVDRFSFNLSLLAFYNVLSQLQLDTVDMEMVWWNCYFICIGDICNGMKFVFWQRNQAKKKMKSSIRSLGSFSKKLLVR